VRVCVSGKLVIATLATALGVGSPSALGVSQLSSEPVGPQDERPELVDPRPDTAGALAALAQEAEQTPLLAVTCGRVACAADQECCNASCGICVEPGATCTNKSCVDEEFPVSAPCGFTTCNVDQVCCNASCGICARLGEPCEDRSCDGPTLPYSPPCGMNTCNVGQVCCNPSCGTCAAPGVPCSQTPCG